jgi:hypothetical protein
MIALFIDMRGILSHSPEVSEGELHCHERSTVEGCRVSSVLRGPHHATSI